MMNTITARAYEIIQAYPELDVYDAVNMARREVHDEYLAGSLITGALAVLAIVLLLAGWVRL